MQKPDFYKLVDRVSATILVVIITLLLVLTYMYNVHPDIDGQSASEKSAASQPIRHH